MLRQFDKPYNPQEVEEKIYRLWEKSGYFNPDNLPVSKSSKLKAKSFCITIPPPNITGSLHMGHALNATIQDILIRKKRMEGYKTLWIPGTDHAGIATQNVVEKQLKKEGVSRHDLGREKFLERVWQWKEEYGNKILDQLKKIGTSLDWSRTRFTMDKDYAEAVETAFLYYYKKGLIYQGDRVVNWCPRCQTSLSDLELEHEEIKGKLYYIKYLVGNAGYIIVATTRPETMLGDTAVAVNPKDKRYKNLIGEIAILPIVNRKIKIIADRTVEMNFGTGAVKITPAHDILDAEIAERHKLSAIQIINKYGRMTEETGKKFEGLKTIEAREKIIAELQKLNLLEKIEDYKLRISKCYRCESVIEPQISKQWFLKMGELAKMAIKSVKSGKIKFHPKRWEKVYFDWLKNIKDWCISRQIWWGHKIPIGGVDDVLDTWFSSALWPFATLGWPKQTKDLKQFYPTQILSTARDIINLWVSRMIFSGLEFTDKEPFEDVIIHATVLVKDGRRMSKSLGTGIDPIDLISRYGADATRFGLIWQAMGAQDIHWDEAAVLAGKKFCNKIWNASRFVLINKPARTDADLKIFRSGFTQKNKKITSADKKILIQLQKTKKSVEKDLDNFRFGQALRKLYDFFWRDFCDIYLEKAKSQMLRPTIVGAPKCPTHRKQVLVRGKQMLTKKILFYVLFESLKLLHPFMPFITEEIWQNLFTRRSLGKGEPINPPAGGKKLLMIEKW